MLAFAVSIFSAETCILSTNRQDSELRGNKSNQVNQLILLLLFKCDTYSYMYIIIRIQFRHIECGCSARVGSV